MNLGELLMTEKGNLRPPVMLSMRDKWLREPSEAKVKEFMRPAVGGKNFTVYEKWRDVMGENVDYFLGNGNHRAVALYLARFRLESFGINELIDLKEADELILSVLERNAQRFRRSFGVMTVEEYVTRYIPNEVLPPT